MFGRRFVSSLRRLAFLLPAVLLGATMLTVEALPAQAADGQILSTITAQVPGCSVGTGVAFDGTNLLLSCWYSSDLWAVSPADGHLLATYTGPTTAGAGFGALAYDRRRNLYWACTYPSQAVVTIQVTGSSLTTTPKFTPQGGCIDGLAYDGTDDSLFVSGDVASTIYHYSTSGSLISDRNIEGQLGFCGNSGLAVGGQWLFMANNGCSEIYRSPKNTGTAPTLFGSYPQRLEDMECDDVTFHSTGKAVIWSKDAYDPVLNAFELNPGDCGFGGQPAGDMSVTPGSQQAPVGATVTFALGSEGGFLEPHPFGVTVLDGPNKGLPVTLTCIDGCSGFLQNTVTFKGSTGAGTGTDTLNLFRDKNSNGIADVGEPQTYAFVRWNEPVHEVGMGDSYSSGEGVNPYDDGTDVDFGSGRNVCHRSQYGYARQTKPPGYADSTYSYVGGVTGTTVDFIACAGATTDNVKTGGEAMYTEPGTEIDQGKLTSNTNLVELTIGGNDIGFTSLLIECAKWDCEDPDTTLDEMQIKDWAAAKLATLPSKLDTVLTQIRSNANNATIVLLGYPRLFPSTAAEQSCGKLSLWNGSEQNWFNTTAQQLNDLMAAAAARAGIHFVSTLDAFNGHSVCGAAGEWLNGATAPNVFDLFHGAIVGSGAFHPNLDGQTTGYAATLNAFLHAASESLPTNPAGLPINPAPQPAALIAQAATTATPLSDLGRLSVLQGAGDARSACLPDGLVRSGAQVRVAGIGYSPGATVSIGWDTGSNTSIPPAPLGTLAADSTGGLQGVITIPDATADSTALLHATGPSKSGSQLDLMAYVGVARACPTQTYNFKGFLAPVANVPVVNTMVAGRAVPIKFSLTGDQGLKVLAANSPTSAQVNCSDGATTGEVSTTSTAGSSTLKYEATNDQYSYVWKTDSKWAGTCRQFTLTLSDGSTHLALFSFR